MSWIDDYRERHETYWKPTYLGKRPEFVDIGEQPASKALRAAMTEGTKGWGTLIGTILSYFTGGTTGGMASKLADKGGMASKVGQAISTGKKSSPYSWKGFGKYMGDTARYGQQKRPSTETYEDWKKRRYGDYWGGAQ